MVESPEKSAATAAAEADQIDLFSFSSRWWTGPEWKRVEEDKAAAKEWEPAPSHLDTLNSSGMFHTVSPDKMSVQYVGSPQHGHDVGAVQGDCPAPTRRVAYYFEMTVKNAGQKGRIAIGFTTKEFNLRRQPGWELNSCGYHGDDGFIYRGQGKGDPFGPTFTSGDTVGAGINYASQVFFFTKNGEIVGKIPKDIKGPLYPTIAVHSQNEEVTVNFGKQPFVYDLEALMVEEKLKQQAMIENESLPPYVSHWIVRSYLLHYGYQDTLESFDVESESMCPPSCNSKQNCTIEQGDVYALNHRKILRQLIMSGDVDSAFHKLQEWYPQIVQNDTSVICFLLHCQRFIEYVRAGFLVEAVYYARAQLNKFFSNKSCADMLEDAIALLAYNDPQGSCVGYLLKESHREFVADAVNAMVLSTNPNLSDPKNYMYSSLEKLLRQLTACCREKRTLNDNQGLAFDLYEELHIDGKGQL